MNPDGLSTEAERRLQRPTGASSDLPMPAFDDADVVGRWRLAQHEAWGENVEPEEPEHRRIVVDGIVCLEVDCLETADTSGLTLLYLHGGGFCLGSPGTAVPITSRLAAAGRVVSVDYRLAPEYPFPAGLDDAERVYRRCRERGPVVVLGDSAGANLALGLAFRVLDERPLGLVLLSPHLDARSRPTTLEMQRMIDAYVGDVDADDPEISPLARSDNELRSLPPVLLQSATTEPLHAQAVAFAERSRARLQAWDGLWHAWHYHRELPEAQHALAEVLIWIKALEK